MTEPAAIVVESVSKAYPTPGGTVQVLTDVSLTALPGTSLAVTGPSGSGKSTLLALIGGLDSPTQGRVLVGGREISRLGATGRADLRRRELGLIFQLDNLLPFLTVFENVALGLALLDSRDQPARFPDVLDVLDALGLTGQLDKLPDQLSGGQRQRVSVARAMVKRPSVVLADEPTGALDADNSAAVVDLMLATCAEVGAALVVVTHDLQVAQRMDTIVTLRGGHLAPGRPTAHAG